MVLHSRLQKLFTCVHEASPGSVLGFEAEQMMMMIMMMMIIMKMLWVMVVVVVVVVVEVVIVVVRQQVKLQKPRTCVDQPKPWCPTGSSRG